MNAPRPGPYAANLRKYYFVSGLYGSLLFLPIWVVYLQEERGLSLSQVTAMEGPFWVAMVLFEVPSGAVADRFGRRTSLAAGMLLSAGAIFLFGIATTYPLLFASYLIWAGALTLISGADAAFIYDNLKAVGRQADYSRIYGRVMAVQATTLMIGTAVGPPLAAITGLWVPIVVTAGFHLVAFFVCLTFREPPRQEDGPALSYVAGIREAGRIAWRSRPIRYVLIGAAAALSTHMAFNVLVQPFLRDQGVDVALFGLLFLPGEILAVFGALIAWRAVRLLGDRASIILVLVAMVGAGAVFTLVGSVFAFAAYPIVALVAAMGRPIVTGYINDRIPSGQRATILSFQQLVLSLILAGMIPASGAVADRSGIGAGFGVVTLVVAIVGATALALWLRADRRERPILPPEPVAAGAADTAS